MRVPDSFVREIAENLAYYGKVRVHPFGIFEVHTRKAGHSVMHPQKRKMYTVGAYKYISFRPLKWFRDIALNDGSVK